MILNEAWVLRAHAGSMHEGMATEKGLELRTCSPPIVDWKDPGQVTPVYTVAVTLMICMYWMVIFHTVSALAVHQGAAAFVRSTETILLMAASSASCAATSTDVLSAFALTCSRVFILLLFPWRLVTLPSYLCLKKHAINSTPHPSGSRAGKMDNSSSQHPRTLVKTAMSMTATIRMAIDDANAASFDGHVLHSRFRLNIPSSHTAQRGPVVPSLHFASTPPRQFSAVGPALRWCVDMRFVSIMPWARAT